MGPLLSGPVISLLDSCPSGLWERLHAAAQGAATSSEKTVLQVTGSVVNPTLILPPGLLNTS